MKFIQSKIETCLSASEVVKSVTILHAVRWVAEAWKNVSEHTVKKWFCKAGNLEQDFTIVQLPSEAYPFAGLDDSVDNCDADDKLLHLMSAFQGSDGACALKEIITAEYEVPICYEFSDDTWNETFMSELLPNTSEACISSDEDE